MKREWVKIETVELDITATSNIPTEELRADEFENGLFTQGVRDSSGPIIEIPYKPSGK